MNAPIAKSNDVLRLDARSFAQNEPGDAQLLAWPNSVDPLMCSVVVNHLGDNFSSSMAVITREQAAALRDHLTDFLEGNI
jgi:hypothetical protein